VILIFLRAVSAESFVARTSSRTLNARSASASAAAARSSRSTRCSRPRRTSTSRCSWTERPS